MERMTRWGEDWGSGVYFCAIQLGMPSHVGWGPGGEFARRTRTHDTDTHPITVGGLVMNRTVLPPSRKKRRE